MSDKDLSRRLMGRLEKLPGKWLIILGALLWSTGGGVTKCFTMDPLLLAALRSLIAGLVLLPFLRPRRIVWNKWLFMLIGANIALVVTILSALRYTTASNALALQYTASAWIVLWGMVILRRRFPRRRLLVVAVVLAGIVVILLEPNSGSNVLGNIYGLMSGMGFAAVTVLYQKAEAGGDLSALAVVHLCTGLVITLVLWLLPGYTLSVPGNAWPYIIYLGLFQIAIGYILYLTGLRKTTPQQATTLSVWEFVLTPVWAFILVGELPTWFGVGGWVLLLLAALLESGVKPPALTPAPPDKT